MTINLINRYQPSSTFLKLSFKVVSRYGFAKYREFLCCEAEGFVSNILAHAFDLEQNTARLYFANIVVHRSFAFTHTNLGGLGSNRFIREDANPHLAFALHVACERDTSRFDLATGEATEFHGFQCERAERDGAPFMCQAPVAAFVLFAIFLTFWL